VRFLRRCSGRRWRRAASRGRGAERVHHRARLAERGGDHGGAAATLAQMTPPCRSNRDRRRQRSDQRAHPCAHGRSGAVDTRSERVCVLFRPVQRTAPLAFPSLPCLPAPLPSRKGPHAAQPRGRVGRARRGHAKKARALHDRCCGLADAAPRSSAPCAKRQSTAGAAPPASPPPEQAARTGSSSETSLMGDGPADDCFGDLAHALLDGCALAAAAEGPGGAPARRSRRDVALCAWWLAPSRLTLTLCGGRPRRAQRRRVRPRRRHAPADVRRRRNGRRLWSAGQGAWALRRIRGER